MQKLLDKKIQRKKLYLRENFTGRTFLCVIFCHCKAMCFRYLYHFVYKFLLFISSCKFFSLYVFFLHSNEFIWLCLFKLFCLCLSVFFDLGFHCVYMFVIVCHYVCASVQFSLCVSLYVSLCLSLCVSLCVSLCKCVVCVILCVSFWFNIVCL